MQYQAQMLKTKYKKQNIRQLIVGQRQAYEGAKSFYTCFLPTIILLVNIATFYNAGFNMSNISIFVLNLFSYAFAFKLYSLCNVIDAHPFVQSDEGIGAVHNQLVQSTITQTQQQQQPLKDCQNQNSFKTDSFVPIIDDRPQQFYCKICQFKCPYRTRHCYKCQICVFRYDHHCFWIGNCVGYANHRQFYCFLLLQTVNNVCTLLALNNLDQALPQIGFWMIAGLYALKFSAFGFIIFTGYLLLYHTMLMLSGMTTWQHMSRSRITYLKYLPSGYNPFSQNIIKNIRQFWIRKKIREIEYKIPSYQESKNIDPGCNIIQNKYYSCC